MYFWEVIKTGRIANVGRSPTSGQSQTAKYSVRADLIRFAPESGYRSPADISRFMRARCGPRSDPPRNPMACRPDGDDGATKIHALTDAEGRPRVLLLLPGNINDIAFAPALTAAAGPIKLPVQT